MICPLCKKKGFISCRRRFYSKSIRCCTNCYNKIKQNKMAQIKAEQRRILKEEGPSIDRLLKKILPKANLILTKRGLIKLRRNKKNNEDIEKFD